MPGKRRPFAEKLLSKVKAGPDEWIWRAAVLAEAKGLGEFLKGHHTILIDDKVPFHGRW